MVHAMDSTDGVMVCAEHYIKNAPTFSQKLRIHPYKDLVLYLSGGGMENKYNKTTKVVTRSCWYLCPCPLAFEFGLFT